MCHCDDEYDDFGDTEELERKPAPPPPLNFANLERDARRRLADALSLDVANHLRAVLRHPPAGILGLDVEHVSEHQMVTHWDGRREAVPLRTSTIATLRATTDCEFVKNLMQASYSRQVVCLERLFVPGSWAVAAMQATAMGEIEIILERVIDY